MSLILGASAFVFSCCCLVGAMITLWPEIATRGRKKNISWWVWIAGSIAGLGFFYAVTVANPGVDSALLLPLPGVYREEATASFKEPYESSTASSPTAAPLEPPATGASPEPSSTALVKAGDSVKYIGGINGNLYHIPGCYLVDRIPPENQRYFKSRAEAEAAGYKACPDCRP